jgi:hypothetical protein
MIRSKEFETSNDVLMSGRTPVMSNYAEIYSPIMNESQPMKDDRSFHEESKSHHHHQSSTSNIMSATSTHNTHDKSANRKLYFQLIDPLQEF